MAAESDEGATVRGFASATFRELEAHKKKVLSVKWNASGSLLASGSLDQTVRLWHVDKHGAVRGGGGVNVWRRNLFVFLLFVCLFVCLVARAWGGGCAPCAVDLTLAARASARAGAVHAGQGCCGVAWPHGRRRAGRMAPVERRRGREREHGQVRAHLGRPRCVRLCVRAGCGTLTLRCLCGSVCVRGRGFCLCMCVCVCVCVGGGGALGGGSVGGSGGMTWVWGSWKVFAQHRDVWGEHIGDLEPRWARDCSR